MTTWVTATPAPQAPLDYEILQESALAMAQATIQNAINESGINRADLARKMQRPRSYVTRMLRGDHNLTVKTFALALAACGYRARLSYGPMQWSWSNLKDKPPAPPPREHMPTGVGISMLAH